MEKSVSVPEKVHVDVRGKHVKVRGGKGEVSRDFESPKFGREIEIKLDGSSVVVSTQSEKKKICAIVTTISKHIRNMIIGVSTGYRYELKIFYSHFPVSVVAEGRHVVVKNFLGEKGTRKADIVGSSSVRIQKDIVSVEGINLEEVSQTAANIEQACKITGKDRRVFTDGIYISGKFLQSGDKL